MKFKALLLLLPLVLSCQNYDFQKTGEDVPTQGNLVIAVDHGDSFFMEQEFDLFRYNYPDAHFKTLYLPESEILQLANNDSVKVMVLNRDFTEKEKKQLKDKNVYLRSARIAYSSMAVIVHKNSPVSQLSMAELTAILEGKTGNWSQPGTQGEITVAIDGQGSHNHLFLQSLSATGKLQVKSAGNLSGPKAVIDFVANNTGAIGFVNINYISDKGFAQSMDNNLSIKVLKIENPKLKSYHLPYQSQIAAKEYPFIQEIFIHNLQGYNGLAVGLMSFISSQPGQILVKKCGLVPALEVGRVIKIENQ